jgi:DNA polymerase-3 subunit delta'
VSWKTIFGHERLVTHFIDLMRNGRLGHAYLFVGPSGIGKRRFACEIARSLLCESPREVGEPCEHCPACQQVESGTHPDLILAARPDDKLELPIDVIREVSRRLALKPARGGRKIAIIDDADDLNDTAANAFLKTLEEPPPRSVLILLATDSETQLPTIVSRCQVIRFSPLPTEKVVEILRNQGYDEAKARRWARLSGGSPGQALALSDDRLWEFRGELASWLQQRSGNPITLAQNWKQFLEEAGKDAAAQRLRAVVSLRFLMDFLNAAIHQAVGDVPEVDDPAGQQAVAALASRWSVDRLLALVDRCLDADMQIYRRVQLTLVIDALAVALT